MESQIRKSRTRLAVLASVVTWALNGCGGGGGGGTDSPPPAPPTPPPETLFVPSNAWNKANPAGAETVGADAFRSMQSKGDLQVITPADRQSTKVAAQRRVADDRAFLESKTDIGSDVKDLLAETSASGKPTAALPDGRKVTLLDRGSRIEAAADAYRRAHDPANALASYRLSYELLSAELKAQVPAPDSLQGASLDQLKQAAKQIDAALATQLDIDRARLDPEAPLPTSNDSNAVQKSEPAGPMMKTPGNGMDNNGACNATGLAKRYWFPLRAFVSPVKNQGERGTCWAFAAVAAVESRERVQNDNAADLSEQFLVNKYKREWFESDYVDGGSSMSALNAAADRNQGLLSEGGWTYNQATGRPDNAFDGDVEGTEDSYKGACTGYTGWCSESAHESPVSCTSVLGINFCGYNKIAFNGPGIPSSRVRLLWSNGQDFNLNQYRALLSSGVSLIASFPVYEGVMAAPSTGLVSDYSKKMKNDKGDLVDGSYGGHLVQIVGFLSNEELSFPGSPVNIGGGGYFIIRNSWGCAGDGGYYYVPADYVSKLFSTIEMPEFDARRSNRWNQEQVTPGGTSGLAIDPQGTKAVDLRVLDNLAGSFKVTHPVANYARLTVTSNVDGKIYDGQWAINPPVGGSLFGNSLPVTFQTQGARTLTFTVRYGTQVVTATKTILVVNTAPKVSLQSTGVPAQGENFVITAVISDLNETNLTNMCNASTWSVTAPDTIVSGTGCVRTIRFGTQLQRDVRVTVRDSEGLDAAVIGSFNVGPPPVNPYPRITEFGVYSRDSRRLGGIFIGCASTLVGNNATIDLRQYGCSLTTQTPWRYFSQLTIDNPGAETLSYDWTYNLYYVSGGPVQHTYNARTTTPQFEFGPVIFGGRDDDKPCTLDVRVNAPEASRSKSIRVWSGRCINIENAPR